MKMLFHNSMSSLLVSNLHKQVLLLGHEAGQTAFSISSELALLGSKFCSLGSSGSSGFPIPVQVLSGCFNSVYVYTFAFDYSTYH